MPVATAARRAAGEGSLNSAARATWPSQWSGHGLTPSRLCQVRHAERGSVW